MILIKLIPDNLQDKSRLKGINNIKRTFNFVDINIFIGFF